MTELPVGTVSLLMADVEGSTRLWEAEPEAMSQAVARLELVLIETADANGGVRTLEQIEGDSFVVVFARAADAVAGAIDLQRADLGPITLRIGLHTGDVTLRDGSYMGPALNRCARLRDLAHGGQTVMSSATHDIVADGLPADRWTVDLGTHRLRDLARPERVFQLCHGDVPVDFPELRSLDARPHNLPLQLSSFIGRQREMTALRKLLVDHRLVTLTGSGGCGKTRLALQVAAEALDDHPDGVWWVDLAPVGDPRLVPRALGQAMTIREVSGEDFTTTLTRLLATRRTLIVIDNCEHLIEASAALCRALLVACPEVVLLATSREPLGLDGETTWRVPSLTLPSADDAAGPSFGAGLETAESVRLFVDRAVLARPTFELTADNAPAVGEICVQLDGLPLAIELAAARLRLMSPQGIAAGMGERFRLLAGTSRTAMPRQRTLEASVDWSWDLLTDDQRIVLRRLSVFAGSFALDSAEAVCAGEDLDPYQVFDLLTQLIDRSLVQTDDHDRYRLLETIRQYARGKLVDAGEADALRRRHLEHFVALMTRAVPEIEAGGTVQWLRRVVTELDNLRAALDWALAAGQADSGLRLATVWPEYWVFCGHTTEAATRMRALMDASEPDETLMARSLATLATVGIWDGTDHEGAREEGERAVRLALDVGDDRLRARTQLHLAWATAVLEPARAMAALEAARQETEAAGDRWGTDRAAVQLGQFHAMAGDYPTARHAWEQAATRSRCAGDLINLGAALTYLGFGAFLQGRAHDAAEEGSEAHAVTTSIGDRVYMVLAKAIHGWGVGVGEDPDLGQRILDEAVREAREVNPHHLGLALWLRAWLAAMIDEHDAARAFADEGLAIMRTVGLRVAVVGCASIGGRTALAEGDSASASAQLDEALAAAAGVPTFVGPALVGQALAARHGGHLPRAEELARDALAQLGPQALDTADGLEALGGVLAQSERVDEATILLAAGESLRQSSGLPRWRADHERFTGDLATVRAAMSDEAYAQAWERGAALSAAEAVAHATRGRGKRTRPSIGWASLTPAELDVVRLVADGLANKEIAERLLISPRTVQAHLTHVYSKLDVTSRVQLAQEATRHT